VQKSDAHAWDTPAKNIVIISGIAAAAVSPYYMKYLWNAFDPWTRHSRGFRVESIPARLSVWIVTRRWRWIKHRRQSLPFTCCAGILNVEYFIVQ
jgi:hypothetical protein